MNEDFDFDLKSFVCVGKCQSNGHASWVFLIQQIALNYSFLGFLCQKTISKSIAEWIR